MLALNGKEVDLSKDNKTTKEIKKCYEEIITRFKLRKKNSYVRFNYPSYMVKKDTDNPGRLKQRASQSIDLVGVESIDGVKNVWTYYKSTKIAENGETVIVEEPLLITPKGLTLQIDDLDLIFFLLYKSQLVEGGKNNYQNQTKMLALIDERKVAQKEADKIKAESKLNALIFNEEEMGGLSDDDLRSVASAYGIVSADTEEIDIIRVALKNKINRTANGKDRFYEFVNLDEMTEIKIAIQRASEKKIIGIDNSNKNKKRWAFCDKDGMARGEKICELIGGTKPELTLAKFLSKHENIYKGIKEKLNAESLTD